MSVFDKLAAPPPTTAVSLAAHERLVAEVLAAVNKYNRTINAEKTRCGMIRAEASGKRIGRPPGDQAAVIAAAQLLAQGRSVRQAAKEMGVPRSTLRRYLGAL